LWVVKEYADRKEKMVNHHGKIGKLVVNLVNLNVAHVHQIIETCQTEKHVQDGSSAQVVGVRAM